MRLGLVAVGRLASGPERDLVRRYVNRFDALARGIGLGRLELQETAEGRSRRAADRRAEEARALRALVPAAGRLVLFDGRGAMLGSAEFAAEIGRTRDGGVPALFFVIGGPDGADESLRGGADSVLSLGRMSMPHQLVRVLVAEQIYRAATILAGHPYHRG